MALLSYQLVQTQQENRELKDEIKLLNSSLAGILDKLVRLEEQRTASRDAKIPDRLESLERSRSESIGQMQSLRAISIIIPIIVGIIGLIVGWYVKAR